MNEFQHRIPKQERVLAVVEAPRHFDEVGRVFNSIAISAGSKLGLVFTAIWLTMLSSPPAWGVASMRRLRSIENNFPTAIRTKMVRTMDNTTVRNITSSILTAS